MRCRLWLHPRPRMGAYCAPPDPYLLKGKKNDVQEHQSAYQSCQTTESALLKVTYDALLAADQGKPILLGMLDMSAAFDCVDHIILIRRLNVSFGIDKNALTSHKVDNTYATTVGRPTYPWLNAAYLKARCSDRSILSFIQQMSPVSRTSTASPFMDMPTKCRSTTTVSSTTCTTSHPGLSTASVVWGSGWRTTDSSSMRRVENQIHLVWFGSSSVQVYVRVDRGQRFLHSSIQDPSLSLAFHVTKLTSTLYFHIRQLRTIRRTLTKNACHALVRALVLSRLDYCNGLLAKAPDYLLAQQLSVVMRAAARLILQVQLPHVSDAIHCQLHWLDILERVRFKLHMRCRTSVQQRVGSFVYLSKYCIPVSSIPGRSYLRSVASGDLFIPATNTVAISPRAFAVACPAAWNSLPLELHDKSLSLMTFRKKLKTYLFKTN